MTPVQINQELEHKTRKCDLEMFTEELQNPPNIPSVPPLIKVVDLIKLTKAVVRSKGKSPKPTPIKNTSTPGQNQLKSTKPLSTSKTLHNNDKHRTLSDPAARNLVIIPRAKPLRKPNHKSPCNSNLSFETDIKSKTIIVQAKPSSTNNRSTPLIVNNTKNVNHTKSESPCNNNNGFAPLVGNSAIYNDLPTPHSKKYPKVYGNPRKSLPKSESNKDSTNQKNTDSISTTTTTHHYNNITIIRNTVNPGWKSKLHFVKPLTEPIPDLKLNNGQPQSVNISRVSPQNSNIKPTRNEVVLTPTPVMQKTAISKTDPKLGSSVQTTLNQFNGAFPVPNGYSLTKSTFQTPVLNGPTKIRTYIKTTWKGVSSVVPISSGQVQDTETSALNPRTGVLAKGIVIYPPNAIKQPYFDVGLPLSVKLVSKLPNTSPTPKAVTLACHNIIPRAPTGNKTLKNVPRNDILTQNDLPIISSKRKALQIPRESFDPMVANNIPSSSGPKKYKRNDTGSVDTLTAVLHSSKPAVPGHRLKPQMSPPKGVIPKSKSTTNTTGEECGEPVNDPKSVTNVVSTPIIKSIEEEKALPIHKNVSPAQQTQLEGPNEYLTRYIAGEGDVTKKIIVTDMVKTLVIKSCRKQKEKRNKEKINTQKITHDFRKDADEPMKIKDEVVNAYPVSKPAPKSKKTVYEEDLTYVTKSKLALEWLEDNMATLRMTRQQRLQEEEYERRKFQQSLTVDDADRFDNVTVQVKRLTKDDLRSLNVKSCKASPRKSTPR